MLAWQALQLPSSSRDQRERAHHSWRKLFALALGILLAGGSVVAQPLGSKQVRVSIEFRDAGMQRPTRCRAAAESSSPSGAARVARGSRRRQSNDPHDALLWDLHDRPGRRRFDSAHRLSGPYEDVRFYRDYVTGAGYVSREVFFESAGTSLKVHADVLGERRIRLRLVPTVSYFSTDGSVRST